jgi:two-component system, OmpR family, alkaline phosphatase synthesis response regulator PhoP
MFIFYLKERVNNMALIYIVEDDASIREIEMIALKNSNYMVQSFDRASTFYAKIEEIIPDLILLDIMLPDEDGYSIVRKLRGNSKTKKVPIIMVTAKTTEMDMVKGLDDGADDYIKKPFSLMELLSRVRALLRRSPQEETGELQVGNILLDHERHIVLADNKNVVLTLKEYELLRYLMMNENIVLSREAIMSRVWDVDFEGETRTVDMHIKTLRQKLGDCGRQIRTIRGVGYSISAEIEDE